MTHRFSDAFPTYRRFDAGLPTSEGRTEPSASVAPDSPIPLFSPQMAVFTPEGYEPNYAYPLVIWFHDTGESEQVLHRIMPEVSDRNALGLALRGERAIGGGRFEWAENVDEQREQRLIAAIRRLRREHHVHTERIVLAGRGVGASVAAGLFLRRPDWFGGLALFDAPAEALSVDLSRREELAGKPVLLDLPVVHLGRGREGAGRLAAAGFDVTFRHVRSRSLPPDTLRSLDRWLLGSVCGVPV